MELDRRREIGLIVREPKVIKRFRSVFEADWGLTEIAANQARDAKKDAKKDNKKEEEKGETKHEPALAAK
jgi:hypothetical protein